MTYKYLTTGELVDELENYSAQINALSMQIEKLCRLASEGKISETIYKELYEDIGKKVDAARRDKLELTEAASNRVKELTDKIAELKYRLERLEVRRMLDFISTEKYSAAKEELLKKIGENDEIALLMGRLLATTDEVFTKIAEYLPENVQPVAPNPMTDAPTIENPSTDGRYAEEVTMQAVPAAPTVAAPTIAAPTAQQQNVEYQLEEALSEQTSLGDEYICPRCQTGNPKDAVFCFACGTRLPSSEATQSEMQEEVRNDMPASLALPERKKEETVVPEVNSKPVKVQKCPSCGMENLSIATYCYQCNTTLAKVSINRNP